MKFNYAKLLGYMKENDVTQESLAEKTDISITTINQNLKHGRPFNVENIMKIASVLKINPCDIPYYFFKTKV